MNKYQILNLIKDKVPQEKLFDEFKKEQSIFTLENTKRDKLFLNIINNLYSLKAKTKAYIILTNMLIFFTVSITFFVLNNISIFTFLFISIMAFFINIVILDVPDKKETISEKYYKDDKYREEFQKHIDFNNKLNEKVDDQLSLGTYKLLAEYLTEDELKKIARFKLTYFDLGLRDYYIFKSEEVIKVRANLERIALANDLRDKKLMLEEKLRQKEKEDQRNYISDSFVSSLYKK